MILKKIIINIVEIITMVAIMSILVSYFFLLPSFSTADSIVAISVLGGSLIGMVSFLRKPISEEDPTFGQIIRVFCADAIIIYYFTPILNSLDMTGISPEFINRKIVSISFVVFYLIALLMYFVVPKFFAELQQGFSELGETAKKIARIICIYGYVSVLWAALYWSLYTRDHCAFSRDIKDIVDALYFSIITIATVGYGDIYPLTLYAKLLVISEIVIGILLLVFAVAVAMTPHNSNHQKASENTRDNH